MKIGYARVSTDEQNLGLQEDALAHAGCRFVETDKGISEADFNRPGLDKALRRLKPGDTFVVWRLDRLGRSLPKLVDFVASLEKRGIRFESITEAISTESPSGTLIFHMMAALAQFERALISQRTKAGMAAARQRGTILGRKRALTTQQQSQALKLLETLPATEVAKRFNVHPRTLRRLKEASSNESHHTERA
ncbi:recombinase family protein [Burkholderia vietnamiensis]|uniref:recombinase family protein n=1 Tax=Burkholderia vietnamiensis TaxID=60552 RepID=UPI001CF42CBE|nr:recombinase family protein [Burkholderia vietnamiensis]MCA8291870.1 recombinase family protein [Burkholderia vietnamiensis]